MFQQLFHSQLARAGRALPCRLALDEADDRLMGQRNVRPACVTIRPPCSLAVCLILV